MSGRRAEALALLGELKKTSEYVSPYELSALHAALGDTEGAFASLERAYDARDPQMKFVKTDFHLDGLRSDPRFGELLRRVGLAT